MRRHIGNELIVALLAAVSLLFAGLFALLLASSTQNPPRPERPTPTPIPATETAIEIAVATTDLPVSPTLPAATSQAQATDLELAPSAARITETAQQSATATVTAGKSATPETGPTDIYASAATAVSTAPESKTPIDQTPSPLPSARPVLALSITAISDPDVSATIAKLTESASQTPISTLALAITGEDVDPSATSVLTANVSATSTFAARVTAESATLTPADTLAPTETATVSLPVTPDAAFTLETSPAPVTSALPTFGTEQPASLTPTIVLTPSPTTQTGDLVRGVTVAAPTLASTSAFTASATDVSPPELTATYTEAASISAGVSTALALATPSVDKIVMVEVTAAGDRFEVDAGVRNVRSRPLPSTTSDRQPPPLPDESASSATTDSARLTTVPTLPSGTPASASPTIVTLLSTASLTSQPLSPTPAMELPASTSGAVSATAAAIPATPQLPEASPALATVALTDIPTSAATPGLTASAAPATEISATMPLLTRPATAYFIAEAPAASATAITSLTSTSASQLTNTMSIPGATTQPARTTVTVSATQPEPTLAIETAEAPAVITAAVTPKQISTSIEPITTLSDFLLRLYRSAVRRPPSPAITPAETKPPEPTLIATSIEEAAETQTFEPMPLALTSRAADVDKTSEPAATAVALTDLATLQVEATEMAQPEAPDTATVIAVDTLTASETARADGAAGAVTVTVEEAADTPAATMVAPTGAPDTATVIAVDKLTASETARAGDAAAAVTGTVEQAADTPAATMDAPTGAPETATVIAVDKLTASETARADDTAAAVTGTVEEAADTPAATMDAPTGAPETAALIGVNILTLTTEAMVESAISTPVDGRLISTPPATALRLEPIRSLSDFLLQLYRSTVLSPSRPAIGPTATSSATALQPASAIPLEAGFVTPAASSTVAAPEATALQPELKDTASVAPETATVIAVDILTPTSEATLTNTGMPTGRAFEVNEAEELVETAIFVTVEETGPSVPTDLPTTATTSAGALPATLKSTSAEAAATELTETLIKATRAFAATLTASPRPTVTTAAAVAASASPTDESEIVLSAATIAPETQALAPTSAIQTATDAPAALPAVLAYLIATPTAFDSTAQEMGPGCQVRADWRPYQVQSSDSLLAVALAANTDLITLREANCLSPVRGILAGDIIVVPELPILPLTPPEALVPPAERDYLQAGCVSPDAQILSPLPKAQLSGIFEIFGRATVPAGGSYEIAVKPAWSDSYHKLLEIDISVADNVIGLVNSEVFGPGLQRLRLTLLDKDGNHLEDSVCEVPVLFLAP